MTKVRAKVLVVEDEWITARDVQDTLKHLGYDAPGTADSGEEALAQAERSRPDLVLMDIRLKGAVDGIAAARELRRRHGTPVVFLTAHSDEATLGRAKEVEPYGFLVKPFSEAELRSTIEIALYKAEAERVRQQSERRFRALTEHSTDLISIVDAEGALRYESAAVKHVLGYETDKRLGRSAFELIHPEDLPEVQERFRWLTEDPRKEHQRVEVRVRHKDGSWRWMEAIGANHLDDPAVRGIVVNSRDITERKRAEEALRRGEERFRNIIENMGEAVIITDLEERVLYANPRIEEIFGYSQDELCGKIASEVLMSPDERAAQKERTTHRAEGISERYEVHHRRKDGTRIWVEIDGGPFRNADGEVTGTLGVVRDITERKRAEEEILRAKQTAEAASRAKSQLLSRTSHELRTPMNAILGFAQVLELDVEREEDRESVEQILRAGRHLLSLIDEVLDIAGAESGQMSLLLEPVAVEAALEGALSLLRPAARGAGVEVSPPMRSGVQVLADAQRLRQVLLNLLSNAIKYNREGGRVDVVSEALAGDRVRIEVRDTGPGIPQEKLSQLFVPFERAGAEQTGAEGTGLGLALSRALVEAMGGRVGVQSTPDEGSTFWIELPRAVGEARPQEQSPPEDGGSAAAPEERARTAAVLYVDDLPDNVRLVERILRRQRPEVELITAAEGRLGLELARERRPELILLDLNLPDMSGEEVLRALQEEEPTRGIPVVMISGDAHPEQIEQLRRAGAREYLTKPFDIFQFLQVLDESLGRMQP